MISSVTRNTQPISRRKRLPPYFKGKEYYCKLYNAAGMRAECTRAWKVCGAAGHRQKESFCDSYTYDFSEDGKTRIIEVINADRTGTNEYSIVRITRNTPEECAEELEGQISDGIFENRRTGAVIEITE